MCWTREPLINYARSQYKNIVMAWILCLGLIGLISNVRAEIPEMPESTEIWLVTYGPGQAYWESFGHNGIWIRDPDLGLDHIFNFGFFDFEQEAFFVRFLQGRMLYFSAAQAVEREFSYYIDQNRSIRAQRLALTPDQASSLTGYLVNEVRPENRDYLYDYYWNNCSSRVRDAIDAALDGDIRAASINLQAKQNQRQHTRRLTFSDFWFYLGLEMSLGSPVDQAISRWDEFFIPENFADGLVELDSTLVVADLMLFESSLPQPPPGAKVTWPRYLLFASAVLLAALLLVKIIGWLSAETLVRGWLLISGLVGVTLLYFWLFTDHDVARNNLNLALFNPLWLICLIGRKGFQLTGWLLLGMGLLALLLSLLTPLQHMADVLAAFLPLNLMAAWVLLRNRAA
jgi:hypothetical protein